MLSIFLVAAFPQNAAQDPMPYVRAHRAGDAALVAGRLEEARAAFESCLELSPSNATVAYALACVLARAGDVPSALEWLERAVQWGYVDGELARWDPDLSSLRQHPAFQHCLAGLPAPSPASRTPNLEILDSKSTPGRHVFVVDQKGILAATSVRPGVMEAFECASGKTIRASELPNEQFWTATFDRSRERLIALTWNGALCCWDFDSGAWSAELARLEPRWSTNGWSTTPLLTFSGAYRMWSSTSQPVDTRPQAQILVQPGGAGLFVLAESRGAVLLDGGGGLVRRFSREELRGVDAAWTPDGRRLLVAVGNSVRFLEAKTGVESSERLDLPENVVALAIAPDGETFGVGCDRNRMFVFDFAARRLLAEATLQDIFDAELPVSRIFYSPDGRFLAGGTMNTGYLHVLSVPNWEPIAMLGQEPQGPSLSWAEPYGLAWSADSARIFLMQTEGSLWTYDLEQRELDVQTWNTGPDAAFCVRGERILVRGTTGTMALDASGRRCLWVRPDLGRVGEVLMAPSGHVDMDLGDVEGLTITDSKRQVPIAAALVRLFDPKRVRAARAGVPLAPVRL